MTIPAASTMIDFSPAAGPAPAVRRVARHALTEAGLLARNGEQVLLALVIPAALLLAGPLLIGSLGLPLGELAPSVLALAVWSSAFTSTAIATGFERRYGVLERMAATPLGRTGLLLGKASAVLLVIIAQVLVLGTLAGLLGWRPRGGLLPTLVLVVATVLAVTTFVALALLLAGTLRAEATLALANLIYLLMLVGGGVVVPVDRYPPVLGDIVRLLPTAAWGEAVRGWSTGSPSWWSLVVLVAWAAVSVAVTQKVFRWMS